MSGAEDRKMTVYADHLTAKGTGREYFRSKTIDLQELMDTVGRYASIRLFNNEKDSESGEKEVYMSIIFDESEAKFLPKKKEGGAPRSSTPSGTPGGVRRV